MIGIGITVMKNNTHMKRLVPIFLACLCLTACQRGTTMDNTSATGSANVSDSTIVKCIADYWRQRYNTDEWYEWIRTHKEEYIQ